MGNWYYSFLYILFETIMNQIWAFFFDKMTMKGFNLSFSLPYYFTILFRNHGKSVCETDITVLYILFETIMNQIWAIFFGKMTMQGFNLSFSLPNLTNINFHLISVQILSFFTQSVDPNLFFSLSIITQVTSEAFFFFLFAHDNFLSSNLGQTRNILKIGSKMT